MHQISSQILITLAFALIGGSCGYGSIKLSRLLIRRRHLDDQLPQRVETIIPIITGLLFGIGYLAFGLSVQLGYLMCMALLAVMVSITDLKHRIIPNELIVAIFFITAGFALIGKMEFDWLSSLWGLLVCLVVFLLPALFGNKIGMGDVKLAAAIGFAAGLMGSMLTIFLMGVLILFSGFFHFNPTVSFLKSMLPMGPFLMTAFMVIQVFISLSAII
jgi:Flp pilus assembly protein protease CpaA